MKYTILILLLIPLFSCNRTDCSKLPSSFKSFNAAEKTVSNASFNYTDKVNTDISSWIRGAKYYSSDNRTGFFILDTDKEDYIYQNMPIDVWNSFKNASSFGGYYNRFIKYRYQLLVTQ